MFSECGYYVKTAIDAILIQQLQIKEKKTRIDMNFISILVRIFISHNKKDLDSPQKNIFLHSLFNQISTKK